MQRDWRYRHAQRLLNIWCKLFIKMSRYPKTHADNHKHTNADDEKVSIGFKICVIITFKDHLCGRKMRINAVAIWRNTLGTINLFCQTV